MLDVKQSLSLANSGSRGGFLLGTDEDGYRRLIETARVWVMDHEGQLTGMAVTMPDPILRTSDVWQKRDLIDWQDPDVEALDLDTLRVGYFDQLAALPDLYVRLAAGVLGLRALADLLADHEHVIATTVVEPIRNVAALKFLQRVGANRVGRVDEVYPEVGPLVSDLFHISREEFDWKIARERAVGRPVVQRVISAALDEELVRTR